MIRTTNEKTWENHRCLASRSRLMYLLAAGILLFAVAGCVALPATEIRQDTFAVADSATLNVDNINGRIEVEGGPGNEVDVRAELRHADRMRYEAVQSGNQITISVDRIGGWWFWFFGGANADIHVTVPEGTALTLKTSNGRIVARGTDRGGVLKTSNGSITLENVKGEFDGTTSNGGIHVDGMEGSGLFKTSNGGVDLQDVSGTFNASTSNGAITFSGELKPGGNNRLTTSNGGVSVELEGTPGIDLDAGTSNGRVTSAHPILATNTGTASLSGKIGTGGTRLFIRTSNGNISIK